MKTLFRNIISENQLETIKPYLPRLRPYTLLPGKACVIIGIRRCGKTTFLKQIWDNLAKKRGANVGHLVYVNFFDERLFGLKAKDLGLLLDAFHELNPDAEPTADVHVFLDEIQIIKGWEYFVDRLLRRPGFHVYLTGSSATLLSKEVASAMRGRSLSHELFPFSFEEFAKAKTRPGRPDVSLHEKGRLLSLLKTYLRNGGFPETLNANNVVRRQILQEYVDVVLLKDVIERYNPTDPLATSYTLRLLMNQIGSTFTVNKTCSRLNSMGLKVTKKEVSEFLQWFQDCYLLFSIPVFSNSVSRQIVNPRKIYCIDTGLAYHVSQTLSENRGRLLENSVFLKLRRQTESIMYYKDNHQREVDFVVLNASKKPHLFQVTLSLDEPDVRKREIDALLSAMTNLKLRSATIITLDEREEIRVGPKKIIVLPAWEFLLSKISL